MAYVAPIHRPTSVRHALKIRFLSEDEDSLILAKVNRLEIWRVTPDGMVCLHTKAIFGTIVFLERLRPKDYTTDLLFVGTDRFQYFTLAWSYERNQLETIQEQHDDSEQFMRQSESLNKCLVDPTGRFIALHLWEGVLNISRLHDRGQKDTIRFLDQVRLSELYVKSSTFLPSHTWPRIAFLYQTNTCHEDAKLAIYRLTGDDRDMTAAKFDPEKREFTDTIRDPLARILIPVPTVEEDENRRRHFRNATTKRAHLGGVIVVGETMLLYYDALDFTAVRETLSQPNIFVAWEAYDERHYFLADDYGHLSILSLVTEGVVVTGMTVKEMTSIDGPPMTTSKASCLAYMGDGMLFLGSHYGDSHLLRVDVERMTIEILRTPSSLSNNAPILDFAVMDMGNRDGDTLRGNEFSSGQTRIVAGCGVYNDGTLRSIRSGIGLEDLGILDDFVNVRGLFALKSRGAPQVDTLVVSFLTDTRVFCFDLFGGIEEASSFQGLTLDQKTLLVANLPGAKILQITPQSVCVFDAEGGVTLNTWTDPEGRAISHASANDRWILLAVQGTTLVSLDMQANLSAATQQVEDSVAENDQISCLRAAQAPGHLGVVGFWKAASVSIVDLSTLRPIHGVTMPQTDDSASVPRDLALVQLHRSDKSDHTLFVAMDDGNVVTFNVSRVDFSLSGRKSVILGSRQARLQLLPQEDKTCHIFATTDHSSLIYSSEEKIVFSATTAEDATFVVSFNSEHFPDCIAIATGSHIRLSRIDVERRTHVSALAVHETVRRVIYSPLNRAFGLACIEKRLVKGEEIVTTSFKLVDEIVFELLGKPFLLDSSTSVEMPESLIRVALHDSNGNKVERFILGTTVLTDPGFNGSSLRGRILVLGIDSNRSPYLVASKSLRGGCLCLGMIGNRIVAGLSKSLVIYKYVEDPDSGSSLEKVASHRLATSPKDLDISGNLIGVSDLMKSLTLVKFDPKAEKVAERLQEVAGHYHSAWASAVCHVEDRTWLQADASGNLVVLQQRLDAAAKDVERTLEVISEMNLGEQVNRIRRVEAPAQEGSIVSPKAFLGTTDGGVYLFGTIRAEYCNLLMEFQSRLAEQIQAPGGIGFDSWRGVRDEYQTAAAPLRFVDGELLERFLDMSDTMQEAFCDGLGPSVERMRNIVEELRRLH